MKKLLITILLTGIGFGKINVVTSITDLADIAKTIGGKRVKVTSIARGNQDPHYVEVLPSYMMKVKRADIYLQVGMELDLWAQQIIDGSRNRKLQIVDCSQRINRMEVPTNKVDARLGDIHKYGNPHYWLDPENGKIIARTIAAALISTDPAGRNMYESNLAQFLQEVDFAMNLWRETYAELKGMNMFFYHNSWPYFTERFGLNVVAHLEPKPGITPSPAHLERLLRIIRNDDITLIAMEPYFSNQAPEYLHQKTGIKIVKLAQSVGAVKEADSYLNMFRYNLEVLKSHLNK
ncbi:MAG: zinc ABC transporter substrate-binding protein [Candidatus Marinimicrobia bacterium]|nr:zinc ABC transporter substrate-binding protein [Candidatus Neomarinimicrobiota bacterium]